MAVGCRMLGAGFLGILLYNVFMYIVVDEILNRLTVDPMAIEIKCV